MFVEDEDVDSDCIILVEGLELVLDKRDIDEVVEGVFDELTDCVEFEDCVDVKEDDKDCVLEFEEEIEIAPEELAS